MNVQAKVEPELSPLAMVAVARALEQWTGREMGHLGTAALLIGQYVGANEVPRQWAESRLQGAAVGRSYYDLYDDSEVNTAIAAGLEAGARCPRHIEDATSADAPTLITATPYVWRATSEIPRREFLYGKHLIRGYITCDAAPGGVGKSSQVIVDALAMVTRRTLLGDEPADQLRVWLWNGEDPREEIERRIAAACGYYQISEADIGGRLFVDTGREKSIVIIKEAGNKLTVATPVVVAVAATIRDNQIDCFTVDPFVTTHEVSENDNTKIAAVAQQWAHIADACQCAVHLVHHVRKGEGRELTVEDMRGGGALGNAARAVRLLNPMTKKDAEAAGVKPHDRFRYFKVTNGKSNLTPRSDHAEWRELVSHPMGNPHPTTFWKVQDHVGVVKRWYWPEGAPEVDLPMEMLEAVKERIRTGEFREDAQAKNWAGAAVAEILELDTSEPLIKKRIKKMLAGWVQAGHFRVEPRRDPGTRKDKKFILVAE